MMLSKIREFVGPDTKIVCDEFSPVWGDFNNNCDMDIANLQALSVTKSEVIVSTKLEFALFSFLCRQQWLRMDVACDTHS